MDAKTKKTTGVGAGVLIVGAVLAILNNDPNDARLPQEIVAAVYNLSDHPTEMNVFYGAPFEQVKERVAKGQYAGVDYFAVPKSALQKQSTKKLFTQKLIASGANIALVDIDAELKAQGVPDSVWVFMWSVEDVVENGEKLNSSLQYAGRFELKEGQSDDTRSVQASE